jgi:hypothetical protein
MFMTNVAINGLGRIGRATLKIVMDIPRESFKWSQISYQNSLSFAFATRALESIAIYWLGFSIRTCKLVWARCTRRDSASVWPAIGHGGSAKSAFVKCRDWGRRSGPLLAFFVVIKGGDMTSAEDNRNRSIEAATPNNVMKDIVRRIEAEYREMPGMCVTPPQAQRLWGLDHVTCELVLTTLLNRGVVRRIRGGMYVKR